MRKRETRFWVTYTCGKMTWRAWVWGTSAAQAWEQHKAKLEQHCDGPHEWVEIEGGTGKQYRGL